MKKGFTLIELLIVIGILAVLSSAVVVVLNPAQLLAQSRDTQRIADMGSLQSAISYYLTTTTATSNFMALGIIGNKCDATGPANANNWWVTYSGAPNPFKGATGTASTQNGRAVNNSGWVPINLTTASGGSPLGVLPVDPLNTGNFYYAYSCYEAGKLFELDAMLESVKYMPKGWNSNDGGDATIGNNTPADNFGFSVYEVGNSLTL